MRPDTDTYFLRMAQLVATRSTCVRRAVGCVLVNARNHVVATGYNGVPAGMPHCNHEKVYLPGPGKPPEIINPHACSGAAAPSGQQLDACMSVHGEQNALLQCGNVYEIDTCYVTHSPCIHCTKLLLNTSCRRIVYIHEYPHQAARDLWVASGRLLEHGRP